MMCRARVYKCNDVKSVSIEKSVYCWVIQNFRYYAVDSQYPADGLNTRIRRRYFDEL